MLFTSRDVEMVVALITVSTPRGIYQPHSKIQANHEGIDGKMINFLLSQDFDNADGRQMRAAWMEKCMNHRKRQDACRECDNLAFPRSVSPATDLTKESRTPRPGIALRSASWMKRGDRGTGGPFDRPPPMLLK
jgi:hypothetical protein